MTSAVQAVADEIRRRLPGVGEVKLHKLLYYAQGHHLAAFDEPLFPETISAWDMGPVVGQYWYAKQNGLLPETSDVLMTEAELNTVGYTLSRYGGLTGADLIRLSHSERPWQEANARREQPNTFARIEQDSIRAYFVEVDNEDDESGVLLDADLLASFLAGAEDRRNGPAQKDSLADLAARLVQPA